MPGEKDRKMFDERGLYLLVRASGSKLWRMKYRFAGKEKLLAVGPYPEVTITQARAARDRAQQQLREGIDPSAEKQVRKAQAVAEALDRFELIARAWHAAQARTLDDGYSTKIMNRLKSHVFPSIGSKPIRSITAPMVLDMIRKVESTGALSMSHRVRNHVSNIFVWAIASGLAETDPAAMIRKALVPKQSKLRPALTKIEPARRQLADVEKRTGVHWVPLLASRLLALTAARPGVVRLAERQEFEDLDGEAPIWRIPAAKMKLTRAQKLDITWEFVIPLSSQAAATARAAISASPACREPNGPAWIFPGMHGWQKPIGETTLSRVYREAGLTGVHVPHGWRSTFSTIMNERAAKEDQERDRAIIDLMLAHAQQGVEPIYNRSMYMQRRRELAQIWGDLLMEGAVEPALLLPSHRPLVPMPREAGHERRKRKRLAP